MHNKPSFFIRTCHKNNHHLLIFSLTVRWTGGHLTRATWSMVPMAVSSTPSCLGKNSSTSLLLICAGKQRVLTHTRCLVTCTWLLMLFITCRSIHLGYVSDTEVKGIPAFRFAPPSDVLAPPDENPSNAGFCVPAGDCLGKGVLKVSVCRQGKPVLGHTAP